MAFQDMPQLPPEYVPRVEKLIEKAKRGEMKKGSVIRAVMPPMVAHVMPVIMRSGGEQIAEMIPQMMSVFPSMLPAMMGKQLFVFIDGVGFFIVKIGVKPNLLELVPSSFEEIKKAGIPGVAMDLNVIPKLLGGMDGMVRILSGGYMKIYGMDELMEMFSGADISRMMYMMPDMMGMITKEVFQSMQEPLQEAVDQLLAANGV